MAAWESPTIAMPTLAPPAGELAANPPSSFLFDNEYTKRVKAGVEQKPAASAAVISMPRLCGLYRYPCAVRMPRR